MFICTYSPSTETSRVGIEWGHKRCCATNGNAISIKNWQNLEPVYGLSVYLQIHILFS